MEISRFKLWEKVTGGGNMKQFLQWLAAMWSLYMNDVVMTNADGIHIVERQRRAGFKDFDEWLVAHMALDFTPERKYIVDYS